jgi:hypothetical protein
VPLRTEEKRCGSPAGFCRAISQTCSKAISLDCGEVIGVMMMTGDSSVPRFRKRKYGDLGDDALGWERALASSCVIYPKVFLFRRLSSMSKSVGLKL